MFVMDGSGAKMPLAPKKAPKMDQATKSVMIIIMTIFFVQVISFVIVLF